MITKLRFIERDGKRILQYAEEATVQDGELVWSWSDVPLETL